MELQMKTLKLFKYMREYSIERVMISVSALLLCAVG
jgi:hypothetical protein